MSFEPVFDMYGIAPPQGEWSYIVDDTNIVYGPGWWPFYRDGKPTGVRVSPDVEFRSWRNEYVLLYPQHGASVQARTNLFLRTQGMGAMTVLIWITFDLRERAFHLPEGLPEHLHEQATSKARRLLNLLMSARSARRRGATEPETAADRADQHP